MIDKFSHGFINSVYDFNEFTLNEVICKLAQKMDEVITQSNESFNYLDWLKGQGLSDEVIGILLAWKDDGTLDTIINDNVFNELNNKIENTKTELDTIAYNIDNENKGSDILNLESALNKGILNLLIPRDITIETLTINNRYQKLDFRGNITITGNGIILNSHNITIKANTIIGENIVIDSGELLPIPTRKCAFDVRGSFANITFNEITGFNYGLLYDDGRNGTENNFNGLIQKCNTAVRLKNTTKSAKHEGNTFDLRIFQCKKGFDIDVNCKYQNIRKVVDNAQINNSLDIDERSGHHIITPYFIRLANSNLSVNNVLFNVNGSGYVEVGNKDNGTRISPSNVEITGATPFIDVKFDNTKDYDYRMLFNPNSMDFKSDNGTALSILNDGYICLPKCIIGNFSPNFTGITLPDDVIQNKIVVAKNSGDSNKTRLYIYSNGWKFIELPERTISSGNNAPTSGTWNIGDKVFNNNPTYARNISHWTCVAGGTDGGKWTAHGCGSGTTANRPSLTINDMGYLYFDNELKKLIRWSGAEWQIPN